jgi:hypothetical protein
LGVDDLVMHFIQFLESTEKQIIGIAQLIEKTKKQLDEAKVIEPQLLIILQKITDLIIAAPDEMRPSIKNAITLHCEELEILRNCHGVTPDNDSWATIEQHDIYPVPKPQLKITPTESETKIFYRNWDLANVSDDHINLDCDRPVTVELDVDNANLTEQESPTQLNFKWLDAARKAVGQRDLDSIWLSIRDSGISANLIDMGLIHKLESIKYKLDQTNLGNLE